MVADISSPTLDRLCLHTVTTKPWAIERAMDEYARAGVKGVTVWREALQGRSAVEIGERIRSLGMKVVSLCRGGFFPSTDSGERQQRLRDNQLAIEQAASLGTSLLVLVPGAHPEQSLEASRFQIEQGLAALLPLAEEMNVRLGIEPLHPMYADTRSAINTLRQALDICDRFQSPCLGVVVDVYHLWWDPVLQQEIMRAGRMGCLFAFHVSDWRVPTRDLLYDRELMGKGCIPLRLIRSWVETAGFSGYCEVEIFSRDYWSMDQNQWLEQIIRSFEHHV